MTVSTPTIAERAIAAWVATEARSLEKGMAINRETAQLVLGINLDDYEPTLVRLEGLSAVIAEEFTVDGIEFQARAGGRSGTIEAQPYGPNTKWITISRIEDLGKILAKKAAKEGVWNI